MEKQINAFKSEDYGDTQILEQLIELLALGGWIIRREESSDDKLAGLAISRGDLRFIVALKICSEGRRDRLVGALSEAILEAGAAASASPGNAAPLAVVAAPRIPRRTAEELIQFRSKVAPGAAIGIIDQEGLRRFLGAGLENLTATPPRATQRKKLRVPDSANVFSDLNQWTLKVLLAPLVSEDHLTAPRGEYRNATELAEAAKVSVMSAFRLIRQLEQDHFLDEESEMLRLVNRKELLRRWQAAYLRPTPEMPLRWIERGKKDPQVSALFRAFDGESLSGSVPPVCLGLSAAAECLGFEPAQGVPSRFYYLGNLDREVLRRIGMSPDDAEFRPDLFLRQPVFEKSIFKAAVTRDGLLVSDIIQVWLDITSPLAPDIELADKIRHRALARIFEE